MAGSMVLGLTGCSGSGSDEVKIGLITKTDSNPYFVKMREAAKARGRAKGAELIALAGKFDGDNEGQVAAIENLVSQGVKGILITPNSSTGMLDAIKKARDAGVIVIALDTATDPADAVDATFATDNKKAGVSCRASGSRPRSASTAPQVADAGRHPRRHRRHLPPRRLSRRDSAHQRLPGDPRQGEHQRRPDQGADRDGEHPAARPDGSTRSTPSTSRPPPVATRRSSPPNRADQITIGSIDGSCTGVADVKAGSIGATVMQFPAKMAEQGVEAVVELRQGRHQAQRLQRHRLAADHRQAGARPRVEGHRLGRTELLGQSPAS